MKSESVRLREGLPSSGARSTECPGIRRMFSPEWWDNYTTSNCGRNETRQPVVKVMAPHKAASLKQKKRFKAEAMALGVGSNDIVLAWRRMIDGATTKATEMFTSLYGGDPTDTVEMTEKAVERVNDAADAAMIYLKKAIDKEIANLKRYRCDLFSLDDQEVFYLRRSIVDFMGNVKIKIGKSSSRSINSRRGSYMTGGGGDSVEVFHCVASSSLNERSAIKLFMSLGIRPEKGTREWFVVPVALFKKISTPEGFRALINKELKTPLQP